VTGARRRGWPSLALAAGVVVAALGASAQPATNSLATQFHDIRGPLAAAGLPAFALTGGGVLLLAGGWLLLRRRAGRDMRTPAPPPAAPQPAPGDRLAQLADDYRLGRCPGDLLILRLDDLIRDALAAGSGIPAHSLTSTELQRHLATIRFADEDARVLLGRLLPLTDRVKFAGHQPVPGEIDDALRAAAGLLAIEMPERSA
jgi:hypothetical protein